MLRPAAAESRPAIRMPVAAARLLRPTARSCNISLAI